MGRFHLVVSCCRRCIMRLINSSLSVVGEAGDPVGLIGGGGADCVDSDPLPDSDGAAAGGEEVDPPNGSGLPIPTTVFLPSRSSSTSEGEMRVIVAPPIVPRTPSTLL